MYNFQHSAADCSEPNKNKYLFKGCKSNINSHIKECKPIKNKQLKKPNTNYIANHFKSKSLVYNFQHGEAD